MDFQGFQKLYKAAHVFLLDCMKFKCQLEKISLAFSASGLPPVLMRKLQVSSVKKGIYPHKWH